MHEGFWLDGRGEEECMKDFGWMVRKKEAARMSQMKVVSQHFMEPEGSILNSQDLFLS
jgi:hypothetical protein